jgi:hypothetical protein
MFECSADDAARKKYEDRVARATQNHSVNKAKKSRGVVSSAFSTSHPAAGVE